MVTLSPDFGIGILVGATLGTALAAWLLRTRIAQRIRRHILRRHGPAGSHPGVAPEVSHAGSMTSGLAHEIKNPLSSIVLNAQLLREGILDSKLPEEELQQLVRRVDSLARETARLKDILEDFLRYAGRIHLDLERCDLREVVDELADFTHPQCERQGVLVRVDLPRSRVEAPVDAGLLKQALLNLMLNAVQAMDANAPGKRRELIVRIEDGASPTRRIHVIDTGPGIEPHLREEIFRPYVTTKKGGSGLGLAVAKRIVEEHGGTIAVFSDVGTGSDFVVSLPSATPDGVSRASPSP